MGFSANDYMVIDSQRLMLAKVRQLHLLHAGYAIGQYNCVCGSIENNRQWLCLGMWPRGQSSVATGFNGFKVLVLF